MKSLSFSEAMVKSWLAGNKQVTRRLMNPQSMVDICECPHSGTGWSRTTGKGIICSCVPVKSPYLPGETVYISPFPVLRKQCPDMIYHKCGTGPGEISDFNCYHDKFKGDTGGYVPCRRLDCPRSHALIVSVRPERVQDITEQEARLEGCDFSGPGSSTPRWNFQQVWESLYPGSWEKNQWCWVYMLKKLDK